MTARAGFTLLQLLMVMTILTLLAAMSVVAMTRVRMTGHRSHPGAMLRVLATHEELWVREDLDGNGLADYWARDVAGMHAVHGKDGQPVWLIDLASARADVTPARDYPELGGTKSPKGGAFFLESMKVDPDGKSYVDASLPAPTAKNCPPGPCTNRSRFGFTAYPSSVGLRDGDEDYHFVYVVGEDGVVWRKDTGVPLPVLDRRDAAPGASGGWTTKWGD
jgi:hypothetical protein